MTPEQQLQLNELVNFKSSLEMSSTIPINIDQAYRERFKTKNNYILYAGSKVTASNSTLNITGLTGVLTTDISIVTLQVKGVTPVTILTNVTVANGITVVFSGNPLTDHTVNYVVIRP